MNELNEIKAIIFDKDGTLLDFNQFWISVTKAVFSKLISDYKLDEKILDVLLLEVGIKDGLALKNGLICKGTYEQLCDAIFQILIKYNNHISNKNLYRNMMKYFNNFSSTGKIVPTCKDLKETLYYLKAKGFILAVATTDNAEITVISLNSLGIINVFDKIYTDGCGLPNKPSPEIVQNLCKTYNLRPKNVLMVGDTETDLLFAANSKIKSALILSNDVLDITKQADITISGISQLKDFLGDN